VDYRDPARNLILFTLGDDGAVADAVPAQAPDGFRRAWERIAAEHRCEPAQVTRIEAYWQPSAIDRRFLRRTFAEVDLDWLFDRPDPGGWDLALDQAREALDAAAGGPGRTAPRPAGTLLPVLRSASLEDSAAVRAAMPWLPVAGDALYATFAHVSRGGGVPVRWDGIDAGRVDELIAIALAEVVDGLTVEALPSASGFVVRVTREEGFGAAGAILLPDFHERLCDETGWPEFAVAITGPDGLWVARAGSPQADALADQVASAPPVAPEFRPSLLRVTGHAIELALEARG